MEKIKLSTIQNVEEFRAIIPVEIDGVTSNIFIENPVGEKYETLYNVITDILEKGETVIDTEIVNDENIVEYMIGLLTNIEVDKDLDIRADDNIVFIEMISFLTEIYEEIVTKIYINLNVLFSAKRTEMQEDKFVKTYSSFLEEVKVDEIEEEGKKNKTQK